MPSLNLDRLRAAGAAITAAPDASPELLELRCRFDPAFARRLERAHEVESGAVSPYGPVSGRPLGAGGGSDAYASCGDCGARRSMNARTPCAACRSDQPPMIHGMPTRLNRHFDHAYR